MRENEKISWTAARWLAAASVLLILGLFIGSLKPAPAESAWDAVDIESVERVAIRAGEQVKKWSLLSGDDRAELILEGPTRLRVDTRLVLDDETPQERPYILDIHLDDMRLDYFKETTSPSGSWTHESWRIGKKRRITLQIPQGEHRLHIGLLAPPGGRCLLRVRQEEPEDISD